MTNTDPSAEFRDVLARYARAMDRLYSGDPEPIKAIYAHSDETSQCGYWGGVEHGWDQVRSRWNWVAAQFVPGEVTHTQELLMTSVTAEMAYAVFIEWAQIRLVDQPDPHRFDGDYDGVGCES